nr:6477_t:CDS:2 [Entrophospora candida]
MYQPKPFSLTTLESNLKKRIRVSKEVATSQVLSRVEKDLWNNLHTHQKEGLVEMVVREGRVLLSDEQGLGKTLQALALCSYYRANWPVLIICPKSVLHVWKNEIIKWLKLPESQIETIDSNKIVKKDRIMFVICGYERFVKESENVTKNYRFDIVIADEAHNIKNKKTQKSSALIPIIKRVKRAILITGTPIPNRPIEIYSLLNSLDPKNFSNELSFAVRYCGAYKDHRLNRWNKLGATNLEELNTVLKKTVLIRRLKADAGYDLPAKEREMVWCDEIEPKLKDKIKKLLEKTDQSYSKIANSLNSEKSDQFAKKYQEGLSRIYSLTGEAKCPFVINYIKDLYENTNKKFIVFAHHKSVLDRMESYMETNGPQSYMRIDGETKSKDREKNCHNFQTNDETRVALLSIMAANNGITLTAADIVLFSELTWDPSALFQGEDRAHRIGRTDTVVVKYIIARGTIDDLMWSVITKKIYTTESILDKDNNQLYIDEFISADDGDKPILTNQHQIPSSIPITATIDQKVDNDKNSTIIRNSPPQNHHHDKSQQSLSKPVTSNSQQATTYSPILVGHKVDHIKEHIAPPQSSPTISKYFRNEFQKATPMVPKMLNTKNRNTIAIKSQKQKTFQTRLDKIYTLPHPPTVSANSSNKVNREGETSKTHVRSKDSWNYFNDDKDKHVGFVK